MVPIDSDGTWNPGMADRLANGVGVVGIGE
jgi:hypothetical protein